MKFHQLLIILGLISGCASVPKEEVLNLPTPISQLNKSDKNRLFTHEIEHSDFSLGISLSGGGMRSASFSVGALAGLNDSGILPRVDYISTVSGGGYASYWYLSALYNSQKENENIQLQMLFDDCYPSKVPSKEGWDLYRKTENHLYSSICYFSKDRLTKPFRFQNQIAQQSDLLNYYQDGGQGFLKNLWPNTLQAIEMSALVSTHILSLPFHYVANTLFDWNWHISPLKRAYNNGIERTFGLVPIDLTDNHIDKKTYFNNRAFLWMNNFEASNLYFHDLEEALVLNRQTCNEKDFLSGQCNRMPIWIVNAASNYTRNICQPEGSGNVSDKIFEFTPFSYGSNQNGYVHKSYKHLSVSDTVQLSGAALDSQYNLFSGTFMSFLFHMMNLNLGEKIDNYHPNSPNMSFRSLLPIPFYCFPRIDSPSKASSIYLSDGAHAENTGAYSLIMRGVKNIIMVDASYDNDGEWKELKNLASLLKKEHGLILSMKDTKGINFELLNAKGNPNNNYVSNPQNALENIFKGQVTGFKNGYIAVNPDKNQINLFFIKTGLIKQLLAENCENSKAYPCSVSRYYQTRHIKEKTKCNSTDGEYLFPNNSTENTSLNMSVDIYFAYRDLARFITRRLKIDGDGQIEIEGLPTNTDVLETLKCEVDCK
jgi:hypothetical protein